MRFEADSGTIRSFSFQGIPVAQAFPSTGRYLRKWLLTLSMVVAGAVSAAELASVPLAELPPEARATRQLILSGGPFPYDKDGIAFGNREGVLPSEARGYYREYTVKTPGARDRGARRIICGGKAATSPDTCYYTQDHYASFRRIVQ